MSGSLSQRFIAARRAVIGKEFSHLNGKQREGVLTTEGALLLLAGAGSGKTTVLIHRIANLIRYGRGSDCDYVPGGIAEEDAALLEAAAQGTVPLTNGIREMCAVDPVSPWQILAITFTNKAADELKNRLNAMLGAVGDGVWAMTFHRACSRILRRDAEKLGFPNEFTIYDSADSLAVMKRVLKEMNLDEKTWPPKAVLAACARFKENMIAPEDYVLREERSGDLRRIRTAQACQAYQKRLKDAGAFDFDDLMYYTVRLLQENPEVLSYYQNKFRYVLIDEYQDTNHLQYLFATLLSGGYGNICVVGDDDQSIYKFRGATIENILSFEKQFGNARTIRLEQNYRSTGNILKAANAVIANNKERKGKNLWTERDGGELITLYTARNEDDEAAFVARTIRTGRRSPRDYAVLYRTNAQSRSLELAMKSFQINYRVFGGTRFFDRAEVKDMLAYLYVISNPTDEVRLLRILNVPARGIGATSVERARQYAQDENRHLYEILREASHYAGISAGKRMEQFCAMIEELQDAVNALPLDEFYDLLLRRTGYLAALESDKADDNLARIENVRELKTSMVKSMEEGQSDLYSFLDEVALYTDMDNYDENADYVSLMTMHSAKGLEFPVVFIVGAEEGLFPGMMSIGDEGEMEEERRLCYVAVTRARERLYISNAAQRMLYGKTTANLPSRFVEEIPESLLERKGMAARRPDAFSRWDGVDYPSFDEERSCARPEREQGRLAWSVDVRSKNPYSRQEGFSSAPRPVRPAAPAPKAPAAPLPEFHVGDLVEHKSFGKGVIRKLTPMGGDALVEIEFESQGTKKLMLRIASQHMKHSDA